MALFTKVFIKRGLTLFVLKRGLSPFVLQPPAYDTNGKKLRANTRTIFFITTSSLLTNLSLSALRDADRVWRAFLAAPVYTNFN